MRTRLTTMLAAALLAIGLIAAPAAAHHDHDESWGPMGPHAHALLLNATFIPNPGPTGPPEIPGAWDRCVDLAGGRVLANSNHHTGIHEGAAGMALGIRAGHAVVPYDCATYARFFASS